MLSTAALQLIWDLIGPHGRAGLNASEIDAALELRAWIVAEDAKTRAPLPTPSPDEPPRG